MGDIEILYCDNHPLKYHNYCKYREIHLIGCNSIIKLKSQAYGTILYYILRDFDVFRVSALQFI